MSKWVIAVDLDDVLAAEAEYVVAYSNKHWGYNLTIDDYRENWNEMWRVDHDEMERRSIELHKSGVEATYRLLTGADTALKSLAERFRLVVVTSRRTIVRDETLQWLKHYFGDIFGEVRFTGFYDNGRTAGHTLTKEEILKELGTDYLIDDQPKHCFAAAAIGVEAILFGDYGVSRQLELPQKVTRCKDWAAVLEYFDAKN